jgi:ankyrin repeat protein
LIIFLPSGLFSLRQQISISATNTGKLCCTTQRTIVLCLWRRHWYKLERISMRGATLDGLSTAQWILTDRYFAINMSGAHGWTPLHYAALAGQSEMARYLLENAADPTIRSKPGGHTALHYAARSERNETGEWRDDATLVRDLIEYGADIDLPADARWPSFSGEEGESQNEWFFDEPPELVYPIHCAVLTGMLSRVEALLEAGADINARTSVYGSTPLDLAARRGQLEMVRFLLRNGATDTAGCKVAHQNIVV